jgi:iron complex transport system permease protein
MLAVVMRRGGPGVLALAGASLLALALYIAIGGSVALPLDEVLRQTLAGDTGEPGANAILWRVRLPRAVACGLVGAMLGVVGSSFQALFRNPLADPYVIGVSSGAAVGGTLAVLLGWETGLAQPALAFIGGFGALALVTGIARRAGGSATSVLLAGVVTGSMLAAWVTLNLVWAGQDSGRVLRWLLGSTTPMFWDRVVVLAVVCVLGSLALWSVSRKLNAVAVSEFMAARQGVDTVRVRRTVLAAGSAMVAAAVGTVGMIGFVGLVAPHIARRLFGNDLRVALPASGLIGALLLMAADVAAQRAQPGAELPLGAVTAVLGAPFLLALLQRGPAAVPD